MSASALLLLLLILLAIFYGSAANEADHGRPSLPWLNDASFRIEPTPAAWEFYDLRNDPGKNRNQYSGPRHAESIAGLKAQLQRTRDALGETDHDRPHIQQVIDAQ